MIEKDLILDGSHMPEHDEIVKYINLPVRDLWRQINAFIQQRYKSLPKITYSVCSGKPGWNVKYQKSGKSICTLYPEKDCFVVLIVVTLDLLPVIEALSEGFTAGVRNIIKKSKPFNGTLWLMIQVSCAETLEDVKQLIVMKQDTKRTK